MGQTEWRSQERQQQSAERNKKAEKLLHSTARERNTQRKLNKKMFVLARALRERGCF